MCAPPPPTETAATSVNEQKTTATKEETTTMEPSAIEIARRVSSASAAYRKPPAFVPSYGTAGFRAEASLLPSTLFRCGVLMAARSASLGNAVTGICVTASHNPPRDNGVKLVDPSGNVLSQTWEPEADALARADDGDDGESGLGGLVRSLFEKVSSEVGTEGNRSNPRPVVWIAHDSRPSSPGLAAAAKAGAEAAILSGNENDNKSVVVLGEMTTPQLHWLVAEANRRIRENEGTVPTLEDYYRELAEGHAELVDGTRPLTSSSPLFVDAAAGVGGAATSRLAELVSPSGLSIVVANGREASLRDPDALNCRRGSDYVQKTRSMPEGMTTTSAVGRDEETPSGSDGAVVSVPPGATCASLDGDADRVVFFAAPGASRRVEEGEGGEESKDRVVLLDGDRIASLLAYFVKDKVLPGLESDEGEERLTIGQVQTSYANGAARSFALSALSSPSCPPPPLAKTGVKHLHAAAERYDVGVYFEANGHGALLLSERFLRVARTRRERELTDGGAPPDAPTPARLALALAKASNQAVGDALSGLLLVDAALRHLGWGFEEWRSMYDDLPSKQLAVRVRDRAVVRMSDDESRAVAPPELAEAVDAAVERANGGAGAGRGEATARAFARPSGTEDVVRVYAEAPTAEGCEKLAVEVARAVWDHAGGVGERP